MMDIYNSYLDEDSYLFELSDSDTYDEEYATHYYHLYSNGLERKLIKPYIENKEEHNQGLELHSKNTYSLKLKSHSVRVRSIRESVHQCKNVLAAIVEKDYKDILNAFNNVVQEGSSHQLFAAMCLHYVSSLSYTEKLNISNILNNLLEYIDRNTIDAMNANYLNLFFRNLDPERCFDLISRIWHLYLDIENALKYSFCKILIESERPRHERFLCANIKNLAYLWKTNNGNRKDPSLLLSLLYHVVTSEQIEDVKFIKSIIATHMDCKELVDALTNYKLHCNTAKLLSFSKLILNLDDILMTCPQQKLWLLFSYLSNLLGLKHYEGFKATIIYFQQFFLSDNCRMIRLIAFVGDALTEKRYYDYINCEISSLMFDVVYSFLVLKHEVDQTKLATFLLHLNHKCHSKLVEKVTVEAGKILKWKTLAPQNITTEENMVIYKCFCIVRQTKKTYRVQDINLEEYISYFDFIEMIDQEEQRQRIIRQTILLLVLLLLLTSITSDGHHKSAKLKKYLSLKYEYDDLALYLLWCSGDVEINPGPTFFKIRPLYASEKERKWICEVCSVLVKLLKELPVTSKPKSLWKEKPTCWPQNEPYFDPCNKSKVLNDDLLSDERLLKCLMRCCDEKKICIPEEYRYEINLLSNNKKTLLFETYIFRKEKHNLCEALSNLLMCKDREKINQDTKNCGLTLNFEITQTSQNLIVTKRKGEIITRTRRDLAVMLCKIIKGLNITDKCDGIWKTPPSKWPSDKPFYSPHNEKKRQGICQDTELVDNLIKYCKSNLVVIPPQYQDMVNAWKEGHLDELINFHTIYANIAKLEHSLKILQIEGILSNPDVIDILKKAGLTLDTDTWRLDDKRTDGNQIVSRQRSQNLVVNPITSVDTSVKKLSSCDRGNRQFQKLNVLKKTTEDSRNTLLSSTDKTTVDADSLSPESTALRKTTSKLIGSEEFNTSRQKRKVNMVKFNLEEHQITKKQKMKSSLSETLPSTQEEEDKLQKQLEEPAPPLSEASEICCPPDFDNILSSLLNDEDLESSINFDEY